MFPSVEEHLTEFLWLINSTQNLTAFTLSIYRRTFDNLRKDVLLLVHVPPSAKGVCLPVCGALGTKYREDPTDGSANSHRGTFVCEAGLSSVTLST